MWCSRPGFVHDPRTLPACLHCVADSPPRRARLGVVSQRAYPGAHGRHGDAPEAGVAQGSIETSHRRGTVGTDREERGYRQHWRVPACADRQCIAFRRILSAPFVLPRYAPRYPPTRYAEQAAPLLDSLPTVMLDMFKCQCTRNKNSKTCFPLLVGDVLQAGVQLGRPLGQGQLSIFMSLRWG